MKHLLQKTALKKNTHIVKKNQVLKGEGKQLF